MKTSHHYLICYDITDEKRLRTIAKMLEKRAIRVQYSVFLFQGTITDFKGLLRILERRIKSSDDLRCYRLSDFSKTFFIGENLFPEHLCL